MAGLELHDKLQFDSADYVCADYVMIIKDMG
jgi:hypothetical protein